MTKADKELLIAIGRAIAHLGVIAPTIFPPGGRSDLLNKAYAVQEELDRETARALK